MPRYFFHIEDGLSSRDDEGTELKDLAVAKCEAVKLAGQVICDTAGGFWDRQDWTLTATNEEGVTLFCLHFVGIESPAVMRHRDPSLILAPLVESRGSTSGPEAPAPDDSPPEGAG